MILIIKSAISFAVPSMINFILCPPFACFRLTPLWRYVKIIMGKCVLFVYPS
nr:MAG TPA: hypothetical protein [Caudoviricetes sp.]